MNNIFGNSNVLQSLNSITGTITLTISLLVILGIAIIVKITKLPFLASVKKFLNWLLNIVAKILHKREKVYHRDIEIGKIDEKRTKVKLYRFLNDLIIDLNMSHYGVTPYELLFLTSLIVFVLTTLLCKMIFGTLLLTGIITPIMIIATFCVMYTKANVAHDARIEAVIQAENIICNNIKAGVVPAIRDNLEQLPSQVRPDFRNFIDNVEYKNYHVKTALQELNIKLGGIADDFIKKCIIFELEEEHGIVGMFSDVVEVNNIKMELRIKMKRHFEEVMNEFKIGAGMIFSFLAGVIIIYPNVRDFYFKTFLGQLVIAIDLLLFIGEFVFITRLRAKEL